MKKVVLFLFLLFCLRSAHAESLGYSPLQSTLFSQTQAVTIANTTAATSIFGTGTGSLTIPANFFVPGRAIYIRVMGYHSASGSPNETVNVNLGSTLLTTTGAVSSGNSTNTMWELRIMLTCYTTGASGTVWTQGYLNETGGGANLFGLSTTSTVTINTTQAQTLNITFQWGTASTSNTITITNAVVNVD